MLRVTKQIIKDENLQKLVAFMWRLTSDVEVAVDHKLLPTLSTDLIINLSDPIYYRFQDTFKVQAPDIHIRLVKKQPQFIHQKSSLNVWGAAFYAYGLYPFLPKPMYKLGGMVLDAASIKAEPITIIKEKLKNVINDADGFVLLEEALLQWLNVNADIDDKNINLIKAFLKQMCHMQVSVFCRNYAISIKTLERTVKKYTGLTPKELQQIGRFQAAGNNLVYNDTLTLLTDLAYDYDYYDQTHFIKDFKAFAGSTPSAFIKDNNSVKKMLK